MTVLVKVRSSFVMLCCAQWKCSGEDGVFDILGAERGHFRGIGLKYYWRTEAWENFWWNFWGISGDGLTWARYKKAKTRNEKLKIGSACVFCCESSFQGRLVIAHIYEAIFGKRGGKMFTLLISETCKVRILIKKNKKNLLHCSILLRFFPDLK